MFLLLILGWTVLPGRPIYWTLVTIAVLFVPPWFEFVFSVTRALMSRRLDPVREAFIGLGTAMVSEFLTLTFLAHQTLLSADAVLRTFYRRIVSRQRLLQWETAAEAEMGTGELAFVDVLLNWTPVVALIVGAIVYFSHRHSFAAALPVLVLWAFSKPVSSWLNCHPEGCRRRPPRETRDFCGMARCTSGAILRRIALRNTIGSFQTMFRSSRPRSLRAYRQPIWACC